MSPVERHSEPPERGFGRDGVSGLVGPSRALRAREVSRPSQAELAAAEAAAAALIAAADRRPR